MWNLLAVVASTLASPEQARLEFTLESCRREYVKVLELRRSRPGDPDGTDPRTARILHRAALAIEEAKQRLETLSGGVKR